MMVTGHHSKLRRMGLVLAGCAILATAAAMAIWANSAWSGHRGSGPMPEFTATSEKLWINSKPLKKADLKGKVLLLEIWTSI